MILLLFADTINRTRVAVIVLVPSIGNNQEVTTTIAECLIDKVTGSVPRRLLRYDEGDLEMGDACHYSTGGTALAVT